MPAEAIVKARSRPARRARVRNTPSAVGERQMFAVQTKRTPMVMAATLAQGYIGAMHQDFLPPGIVVLTGAGISKESGIDTFRDKDGLQECVIKLDVKPIANWRTYK